MERQGKHKGLTTDSTEKIAIRILSYLNENPQASDTIEGILHWWLLDRIIVEEEAVVKQVLTQLVERNLIMVAQTTDARPYYRLNTEQIDEVRKLLHEEVNQND